ncbi:MAG: hypothetical protein WC322_06730, partial [Candidatus Paceibacterota bacterium]
MTITCAVFGLTFAIKYTSPGPPFFDDDEVDDVAFETITCEGMDASFLYDSTLWPEIEAAFFEEFDLEQARLL